MYKEMSALEEDRIKVRLYREFHEQNRELFIKNRQQYHELQSRYIENKLLDIKIRKAKI